MIPLRFHIVSLIGVFLALAIGIVVGSTVVDRAIVEGLENRIETVSQNLDRRQQANEELRGELSRLERYIERSASHTVDGRLADRAVAVVAARGVDEDIVEDTTDLLQDAGALTPEVLWLEPRWALDAVEDRHRLAEALGIPIAGPGAMRVAAWRLVIDQVVDPQPLEEGVPPGPAGEPAAGQGDAGVTQPPDGAAPAPPDPLGSLITAGFVTPAAVGPGDVTTAALVGQIDRLLMVGTGADEVGSAEVMLPMVRIAVAGGLPVLVAERDGEGRSEDDEPPVHQSPVQAVRADDELDARVATVDHLGQVTGRVAAVLALRDLGSAISGHYGFDDGADEVVPERANR